MLSIFISIIATSADVSTKYKEIILGDLAIDIADSGPGAIRWG